MRYEDGQLLERIVSRSLRGAFPWYLADELKRNTFVSQCDPDFSRIGRGFRTNEFEHSDGFPIVALLMERKFTFPLGRSGMTQYGCTINSGLSMMLSLGANCLIVIWNHAQNSNV